MLYIVFAHFFLGNVDTCLQFYNSDYNFHMHHKSPEIDIFILSSEDMLQLVNCLKNPSNPKINGHPGCKQDFSWFM